MDCLLQRSSSPSETSVRCELVVERGLGLSLPRPAQASVSLLERKGRLQTIQNRCLKNNNFNVRSGRHSSIVTQRQAHRTGTGGPEQRGVRELQSPSPHPPPTDCLGERKNRQQPCTLSGVCKRQPPFYKIRDPPQHHPGSQRFSKRSEAAISEASSNEERERK